MCTPKPSERTKVVAAQVTPDAHARVVAEARRRGVTVSAMLWEIIAPALAQMPPALTPEPAPPQPAPPPPARRIVFYAEERRDMTGIVMGDPPPERSALGRRHVR